MASKAEGDAIVKMGCNAVEVGEGGIGGGGLEGVKRGLGVAVAWMR